MDFRLLRASSGILPLWPYLAAVECAIDLLEHDFEGRKHAAFVYLHSFARGPKHDLCMRVAVWPSCTMQYRLTVNP